MASDSLHRLNFEHTFAWVKLPQVVSSIAVCSCKSSRAKTFLMWCPSSNLQVLVLLANRMEWRCAFGCSHKPFLVNKNSSKRKMSFNEHLNQAETLKLNRRN